MKTTKIIASLKNNIEVFTGLLLSVPLDQIDWKLDDSQWSLRQIAHHLLDEEVMDFRERVLFCLEGRPGYPPVIDPEGWAKSARYLEGDFDEAVQTFIQERKESINILENLNASNWHNSFNHPELGELSAGFFLNNWLAHDYLHIRQINKANYLYLKEKSGHSLQYAGKW